VAKLQQVEILTGQGRPFAGGSATLHSGKRTDLFALAC
jgi:hypothetical protein